MEKKGWIFIFVLSIILTGCLSDKKETKLYCGVKNNESNIQFGPNKGPGLEIFKAKCATCHMYEKNSTGPKMNGLFKRILNEKWFIEFITSQDSLIEIKEEYTIQIMDWSPVEYIHHFNDLTSKEKNDLVTYIKS